MKKTTFAKIAGGLALLAVSSVAMASVVNTKHNLGANNNNTAANQFGSNHTNATTEICIFCHTPHGGDQTVDAPLWNRASSSGTPIAYQRFSALGRLTFDAKEAPIGSVSAACLSCHDGTQAMDAVINSPGSDTIGTVGTGTLAGSGGFSQGRRMGDGSFLPADGTWNGVGIPRGDMVYLGTDLRNDHPISMQYGGGGISAGANVAAATTDPDFAQAGAFTGLPGGATSAGVGNPSHAGAGNTTGAVAGSGTGAVKSSGTGGSTRWWVSTTASNTYTSKDFPLYSRTDVSGQATVVQPTVECGTCHDPHSANSTFLRLVGGNKGSQVCLTCHAK